jgi:hypothetical protein
VLKSCDRKEVTAKGPGMVGRGACPGQTPGPTNSSSEARVGLSFGTSFSDLVLVGLSRPAVNTVAPVGLLAINMTSLVQ